MQFINRHFASQQAADFSHGEVLLEKKSAFQAHFAIVHDQAEVDSMPKSHIALFWLYFFVFIFTLLFLH